MLETTLHDAALVRSMMPVLVRVVVTRGRNLVVILPRINSPLVVPYMFMCRAPVPTTTGTVPVRLLDPLTQTRMPLVLALTIGIPEPCMMVRTRFVFFCGMSMLTRFCVLTTVAVLVCLHRLMDRISVDLKLRVLSIGVTMFNAVVPACLVVRLFCSSVVPLDPRYRSVMLIAMPGWVLQTTLTMFTGMCARARCRLPGRPHLCMTLLIGLGRAVIRCMFRVVVVMCGMLNSRWLSPFVLTLPLPDLSTLSVPVVLTLVVRLLNVLVTVSNSLPPVLAPVRVRCLRVCVVRLVRWYIVLNILGSNLLSTKNKSNL